MPWAARDAEDRTVQNIFHYRNDGVRGDARLQCYRHCLQLGSAASGQAEGIRIPISRRIFAKLETHMECTDAGGMKPKDLHRPITVQTVIGLRGVANLVAPKSKGSRVVADYADLVRHLGVIRDLRAGPGLARLRILHRVYLAFGGIIVDHLSDRPAATVCEVAHAD